MRLKRTYSSREVAALTGLSAKQLQLWDTGGLLSAAIPSHKTAKGGHTERRYTPIELFELLVLADLRRRGFTIPQLHAIVNVLERQFHTSLFEAAPCLVGAAEAERHAPKKPQAARQKVVESRRSPLRQHVEEHGLRLRPLTAIDQDLRDVDTRGRRAHCAAHLQKRIPAPLPKRRKTDHRHV